MGKKGRFPSFPSPSPLFHFFALISFLSRPKPKIPLFGLSLLRNQTEPLATQAVKIHFEFAQFSFFLTHLELETTNTFMQNRSSLENHARFHIKMAQKPLAYRAAHTYMAYQKGVPPPGGGLHGHELDLLVIACNDHARDLLSLKNNSAERSAAPQTSFSIYRFQIFSIHQLRISSDHFISLTFIRLQISLFCISCDHGCL